MKKQRFDAHCHIFTVDYLLDEGRDMIRDIGSHKYPFHKPAADFIAKISRTTGTDSEKSKTGEIDWKSVLNVLCWLFEILHAAKTSEAENLDFLQYEAKLAYPGCDSRIIPLMMDIFYILAYPLDKGENVPAAEAMLVERESVTVDQETEDAWDKVLDGFVDYIKSKQNDATAESSLAEAAIKAVESRRGVGKSLQSRKAVVEGGYSSGFGFYPTTGFCNHMDALMELVATRTDELYPFVAIDPRRPGIVKDLCSGAFFTGEKKFYGVKLYPRLGFHPECKPMESVYEFCNKNNLPITFHCGKGGFPPTTEWPYTEFGNPANFENVVKTYPDLRIDFAHMGSSDPTFKWADEVARLVEAYDNVYTDLSCYTDLDELTRMKQYWDKSEKLRERLMFGTDFDVVYFTKIITLAKYYDNFKTVFSKEDMTVMTSDTPRKFLGLE